MTRPDPALLDHDPNGGSPCRERRYVHASAVAIRGRALLILGSSRSGKSRLAFALIAASRPACPVVLIGDDRVLLSTSASRLMAWPHPRIAGFIERRGLGIVASPHLDRAPVVAVVELGRARSGHVATADGAFPRDTPGQDLPRLAIVGADDAHQASAQVLRWWATLPGAT